MRLLQHLRHPNIVNYHESFEDKNQKLCIIMEYCERGDLYLELKRAKGRHLPEKVTSHCVPPLQMLQLHFCAVAARLIPSRSRRSRVSQ